MNALDGESDNDAAFGHGGDGGWGLLVASPSSSSSSGSAADGDWAALAQPPGGASDSDAEVGGLDGGVEADLGAPFPEMPTAPRPAEEVVPLWHPSSREVKLFIGETTAKFEAILAAHTRQREPPAVVPEAAMEADPPQNDVARAEGAPGGGLPPGGVAAPAIPAGGPPPAHSHLFAAAKKDADEMIQAMDHFTTLLNRYTTLADDTESAAIIDKDLSHPNASLNSGSMSWQAAQLGVSRHKLRDSRSLHACASLLTQFSEVQKMLAAIAADTRRLGGRLLTYTTVLRYDETPMKLVTVDRECVSGLPEEFFESKQVSDDAWALLQHQMRDSAPTKLLQTEYTVSALVFVLDRYVLFSFPIVTPIQAMARTTTNVFYSCLEISEGAMGLSSAKSSFSRSQRLSSTDGDKAIARCERGRGMLQESEALMRTVCLIHKLGAIRESVCDILLGVVQKVKHVVLGLQFGNHMKMFRASFRKVLLGRLQIVRDRKPSAAVMRRNREIMDICMPDTLTLRTKRLTILSLCAGDWADRTRVFYFARPEETDADIKSKLLGPFTAAMVGKGPISFPSRNFLHAEDSLQYLSLLEAVHGLFSLVFAEFCAALNPKSAEHGKGAGKGVAAPAPAIEDAPPLLALADDAHAGVGGGGADGAAPGPHCGDKQGGNADRERDQHRYRQTGLAWCKSGAVMQESMSLLKVLMPHVDLMAKEFHMTGERFEKDERIKDSRSRKDQAAGVPCEEAPYVRRFRLVEAFKGTHTKRFLQQTYELMRSPDAWEWLPMQERTHSARSVLFLALARGSSRVHTLQDSRTNYPYKLLACTSCPEVLPHIQRDRGCPRRMDEWSHDFLVHYPDVTAPDAQADIHATNLLAREETLRIERMHARLRRYLLGRSVQCRCVDIDALNHHWVSTLLNEFSKGLWSKGPKSSQPMPRVDGGPDDVGRPEREVEDPPPAKKRRHLSAWNVYVSKESPGLGGNLNEHAPDLSAKFNTLPDDQLAALLEKTAKANEAIDHGNDAPLGRSRAVRDLQLGADACSVLACRHAPASDLALQISHTAPEDLWDHVGLVGKEVSWEAQSCNNVSQWSALLVVCVFF